MSGDPYRKVQSGQRLKIPAEAWNSCLDAAADLKSRQLARGAGTPTGGDRPGICVRNDTGADLAQFSVVRLDGVVITEAADHNQFAMGPICKAVTPAAGCFVAVIQEPIRNGAFGRALVDGLSPVKLSILPTSEQWAFATAQTDTLTPGATGSCRILHSEDGGSGSGSDIWALVAINVGAAPSGVAVPVQVVSFGDEMYTVDVYADGRDQPSTGEAILQVIQAHWEDEIPAGTWLIAFPSDFALVAGD